VIFLDANVFLRHFGEPRTAVDAERAELASALFDRVRDGHPVVTTSEVVLHEVCFILTSPRHYGHLSTEVATDFIQYAGFRFPPGERELYLRAFELWRERPKLEFSDSVIAARCDAAGHDLATFDRHFDAIPTVSRWDWGTTPA
jgi:predicted nucleic acid-binding protein